MTKLNVTPVSPANVALLVALVALVSVGRSEGTVVLKEGRKFDRIFVDGKVRYFVARDDGTIFGAKSDLAPNFDWYFGTTATADKWNWSTFHATPDNDASVIAVSTYGKNRDGSKPTYVRYRQKTADELAAPVVATPDVAPVTSDETVNASQLVTV